MDGKDIYLHDSKGNPEFFTQLGKEHHLIVDNALACVLLSEKDPVNLPWKDLDVDVVLECTGFFVKDDAAKAHIEAGAKKVVVSAPTKGGTAQTLLLGANHDSYSGNDLISNASCTTNCVSPVVSVLHKKFGIVKSALTTIHAVTAGQNVVDGPPNPKKPDMRRARAAGWNMVPTSTGAAKATAEVIPELKGMFDGIAIRVPIITGSISDITMLLAKKTTVEEVNNALEEASKKPFYEGILKTTYEPIVSSDIIGSTYSSIVDLSMTKVIDGDLVKILAWYDNEWGYSNRLVEMALLAVSK
jgi:glyceraldehyde 3-phosphate dehydrogenase